MVLILHTLGFLFRQQSISRLAHLAVFAETHDRVDIIHYQLVDLLFLDQLAGFHGIEEEIVAQLSRQVGGDNFIHHLFVLCPVGLG